MRGLEYLVCLHDPRDDLPCRIEIDIAGSTTETVNEPGRDVRDALVRLLKRRYPGLQFDASGAPRYMVGVPAWRDSLDNLEEHLERIGEVCLAVMMHEPTSLSMSWAVMHIPL